MQNVDECEAVLASISYHERTKLKRRPLTDSKDVRSQGALSVDSALSSPSLLRERGGTPDHPYDSRTPAPRPRQVPSFYSPSNNVALARDDSAVLRLSGGSTQSSRQARSSALQKVMGEAAVLQEAMDCNKGGRAALHISVPWAPAVTPSPPRRSIPSEMKRARRRPHFEPAIKSTMSSKTKDIEQALAKTKRELKMSVKESRASTTALFEEVEGMAARVNTFVSAAPLSENTGTNDADIAALRKRLASKQLEVDVLNSRLRMFTNTPSATASPAITPRSMAWTSEEGPSERSVKLEEATRHAIKRSESMIIAEVQENELMNSTFNRIQSELVMLEGADIDDEHPLDVEFLEELAEADSTTERHEHIHLALRDAEKFEEKLKTLNQAVDRKKQRLKQRIRRLSLASALSGTSADRPVSPLRLYTASKQSSPNKTPRGTENIDDKDHKDGTDKPSLASGAFHAFDNPLEETTQDMDDRHKAERRELELHEEVQLQELESTMFLRIHALDEEKEKAVSAAQESLHAQLMETEDGDEDTYLALVADFEAKVDAAEQLRVQKKDALLKDEEEKQKEACKKAMHSMEDRHARERLQRKLAQKQRRFRCAVVDVELEQLRTEGEAQISAEAEHKSLADRQSAGETRRKLAIFGSGELSAIAKKRMFQLKQQAEAKTSAILAQRRITLDDTVDRIRLEKHQSLQQEGALGALRAQHKREEAEAEKTSRVLAARQEAFAQAAVDVILEEKANKLSLLADTHGTQLAGSSTREERAQIDQNYEKRLARLETETAKEKEEIWARSSQLSLSITEAERQALSKRHRGQEIELRLLSEKRRKQHAELEVKLTQQTEVISRKLVDDVALLETQNNQSQVAAREVLHNRLGQQGISEEEKEQLQREFDGKVALMNAKLRETVLQMETTARAKAKSLREIERNALIQQHKEEIQHERQKNKKRTEMRLSIRSKAMMEAREEMSSLNEEVVQHEIKCKEEIQSAKEEMTTKLAKASTETDRKQAVLDFTKRSQDIKRDLGSVHAHNQISTLSRLQVIQEGMELDQLALMNPEGSKDELLAQQHEAEFEELRAQIDNKKSMAEANLQKRLKEVEQEEQEQISVLSKAMEKRVAELKDAGEIAKVKAEFSRTFEAIEKSYSSEKRRRRRSFTQRIHSNTAEEQRELRRQQTLENMEGKLLEQRHLLKEYKRKADMAQDALRALTEEQDRTEKLRSEAELALNKLRSEADATLLSSVTSGAEKQKAKEDYEAKTRELKKHFDERMEREKLERHKRLRLLEAKRELELKETAEVQKLEFRQAMEEKRLNRHIDRLKRDTLDNLARESMAVDQQIEEARISLKSPKDSGAMHSLEGDERKFSQKVTDLREELEQKEVVAQKYIEETEKRERDALESKQEAERAAQRNALKAQHEELRRMQAQLQAKEAMRARELKTVRDGLTAEYRRKRSLKEQEMEIAIARATSPDEQLAHRRRFSLQLNALHVEHEDKIKEQEDKLRKEFELERQKQEQELKDRHVEELREMEEEYSKQRAEQIKIMEEATKKQREELNVMQDRMASMESHHDEALRKAHMAMEAALDSAMTEEDRAKIQAKFEKESHAMADSLQTQQHEAMQRMQMRIEVIVQDKEKRIYDERRKMIFKAQEEERKRTQQMTVIFERQQQTLREEKYALEQSVLNLKTVMKNMTPNEKADTGGHSLDAMAALSMLDGVEDAKTREEKLLEHIQKLHAQLMETEEDLAETEKEIQDQTIRSNVSHGSFLPSLPAIADVSVDYGDTDVQGSSYNSSD